MITRGLLFPAGHLGRLRMPVSWPLMAADSFSQTMNITEKSNKAETLSAACEAIDFYSAQAAELRLQRKALLIALAVVLTLLFS